MEFDNLPKTSGVYLFYENNKTPIYIGKAINIHNRVKSHRDFFMPKVRKVDYIETNSEIEALLLEANLIKKYQPKYNVMWRDDKNYFYVAIARNAQKIPYIYITHQKSNKARYIGPFVEGTALKKILRFLRRVFPYYTAGKHPKTKCTWCHLDLCPRLEEAPPSLASLAPGGRLALPAGGAAGLASAIKKYRSDIKKLILILQGKRSRVLSSLRLDMKKLSLEKNFEQAAIVRDQITALKRIMAHTRVIKNESSKAFGRIEAYDVSNIQGKFATGSMVVFVNGQPDKSQYKKFKIRFSDTPNDIAMLKEVLIRRFSHAEWPKPDAILIDGGHAQLNVAIKCKTSGVKVLSLAKGQQELFAEGQKNPTPLKDLPQETKNLILRLDSEAHRFAVSYHRALRKKDLLH